MNRPGTTGLDNLIYYRLIALWVLCEAMLGGIIHGLKIPVSGLVVGSSAVVCICLLAYYVPVRGAIIKATVIVAVFKMMLSPQAPPPAYIAVFFQGFTGELLFLNRRFYRISCLLLGITALLESGLQRIFVLTIIYGNDLWKAVNDFFNRLTGQKEITNYSFFIISGYVLLHVVAGLLIGLWAGMLPYNIKQLGALQKQYPVVISNVTKASGAGTKRNKRPKKIIFIIWLFLLLLYAQSWFKIGRPLLPSAISLRIFLRSIMIVLAWYFIIGPALKRLLNVWLQKKQQQSQQDIQQVLQLLPATQQLISKSWQLAADRKGWKKIILCCKIILANTFHQPDVRPKEPFRKIYILTGPIQTGKTTTVINWSANRKDVYGILTPVVNGKRVFINANTKEQFPMEITGQEETLFVGRFEFSKAAFDKASEIIRDAISKEGWLVFDEIGPLELSGSGFYEILKETLQQRVYTTLILVVRDSLLPEIIKFFKLNPDDITIIDKISPVFETSI